jgi:putative two-component system response regulator
MMHATIGGEPDAAAAHPRAKYLQMVYDIAFTHHESSTARLPERLRGDEIPLCGRSSPADVYDALTTARVYKPAYSHEVAKNIIRRTASTDPKSSTPS